MYSCPRCNNELPTNARFCTKCGFNQTNARMTAVSSQQASPPPASEGGKGPATPIPSNQSIIRPVGPAPKRGTNPATPDRPNGNVPPTQQAPMPMAFIPESPVPSQKPASAKGEGESPIQKIGPALPLPKGPQQPPQTPMVAQTMQPMAFQPAAPTPQAKKGAPPLTTPQGKAGQAKPKGLPQSPQTPQPPQKPSASQLPTTPFQRPNSNGQAPTSEKQRNPASNMPNLPQTPYQHSDNGESMAATSKAAEHWHNSWLDRQRAEAGPAVGITRGQAVVPEPLLAMQQSLARMRAVIFTQNTKKQSQGMGFSFWLAVAMIFCLIIGLGTYIISTYIPNGQLQNKIAVTSDGPIPLLTIQNKQNTIIVGQLLRLHGDHFGAHHTITFFLNSIALQAKSGSVVSSAKGAFDASLTITPTTLVGSYVLEAVDNQAGKHAFANVQVLPATTPTNTTALELLTKQGTAITTLTFKGQVSRGNLPRQDVVLHNTSNAVIPWTADTITNNGVNWLIIDDGLSGGQLNSNESTTIGVSILTVGMTSGLYTGDIIFTVGNNQQVVLPVSLQLTDVNNELVVSPNPVIAIIQAGGTCLPDTTLTLINLSGTSASWDVKGDNAFNQQHIHFDGQLEESNTLLSGNTKIISIACVGVQLGMTYHITVYYNGQSVHVPINVRAA